MPVRQSALWAELAAAAAVVSPAAQSDDSAPPFMFDVLLCHQLRLEPSAEQFIRTGTTARLITHRAEIVIYFSN